MRQSLATLAARAPNLARLRGARHASRARRLALAPKLPNAQIIRYLRVTNALQDEVQALVARELFGEALGSIRVDGLILPGDFEVRFARLNDRLGQTFGGGPLKDLIREQGEGVVQHTTKEVARTMSIDLRGSEGQLEPYVQRFVHDNVNLIRSVSFEQLAKMREIVSGYHAGQTNQRSLRDQIMDTFNVSRARASLIARDQILKANAGISKLRQQQVGVTEYTWTTAGDERVRGLIGGKWQDSDAKHAPLDGLVFKWSEPPVTNPATGERNHPGQDYQCRCIAVPVVDHLLGR